MRAIKTFSLSATLLLILLASPSTFGEITPQELEKKVNTFLVNIASGLNENYPMRVDRYILLKNVVVDGTTMIYRYLVDFRGLAEFTYDQFDVYPTLSDIERGLRTSSIKEDCADPNDPFFRIGASIGRYYYDQYNNLKISIITSKSDCN